MRSIDVAKSLTPQFVIDLSLAGWRRATGNTRRLFHGDDQLFKELVRSVRVYGEYGMGSSTLWVLDNCHCTVLAVDSDPVWISHVREKAQSTGRLQALHVDVGELLRMGRPKSFAKRDNFLSYCAAIWQSPIKPELVLIDGRFRVCCFLNCLLHAEVGTKILFDDYLYRPGYHIVEDFVKPSDFCGRQALFVVPDGLDRERIEEEMHKFSYVTD